MRNLSRVALASCLFFLTGSLVANFVFATEKIDINTAPLEELVKIIHIGEVRALELISLRPFSSLDDLAKIKGLGEKRIKDIKKQGLAWVDTREEPESGSESKSAPEPKLLAQEEPKPIEEPRPEPEPKEEVEVDVDVRRQHQQITYPSGIIINEILPNTPLGIRDEEGEYIEIFNQNNFEVDLSEWQIADIEGATKTYTFPKGIKISAKGFLVLSRPTTKITLNNDGDGLNLIQPDGKIIDSVSFEKAPRGESYNRTESGWAWSNILTPGSANITPAPVLEAGEIKPSEEKGKELFSEKGVEESLSRKELAAIGEQFPERPSNSFFILLTALAVAISSGIIILILKRKTY